MTAASILSVRSESIQEARQASTGIYNLLSVPGVNHVLRDISEKSITTIEFE